MSDAREEVLCRIRAALNDGDATRQAPGTGAGTSAAPAGTRTPVRDAAEVAPRALAALFRERVEDYRATVSAVPVADAPAAVAAILARHGARRVIAPAGLASELLPADVLAVPGDLAATYSELDAVDGVITACALAIAETGTLVLDGGPDQGPRVLTLLPDLHVCLVRSEQIVATVPEAIEAVGPAVAGRRAPITFISGPSATSDIELQRVEGVHGPRRLEVVLLES